MRCRKCDPCMKFRIREWVAKAMRRYFWKFNFRWVYKDTGGSSEKLYLWTLGTNWKDGWHKVGKHFRWHGMKNLKRCFTLMRKRLNIRTKRLTCGDPLIYFRPLVYVFEEGKAGYLHVHMVARSWMDQEVVRDIWSEITGIPNPNVGYSPPPIKKCCKEETCHGKHDKYLEPHFAILYLAKYIAKNMRNYYWMGEMRGNIPEYERKHKCYHKVWDEICNEWIYRFEIQTYSELIPDYYNISLPISRDIEKPQDKFIKGNWVFYSYGETEVVL